MVRIALSTISICVALPAWALSSLPWTTWTWALCWPSRSVTHMNSIASALGLVHPSALPSLHSLARIDPPLLALSMVKVSLLLPLRSCAWFDLFLSVLGLVQLDVLAFLRGRVCTGLTMFTLGLLRLESLRSP